MARARLALIYLLLVGFQPVCAEEIKVLLNPKTTAAANALIIEFPEKQLVRKGQRTLDYRILNRTRQHVFVVVESRNVMGWDRLESRSILKMGGGMSVGASSTHELLRLLYAPHLDADGKPSSGEEMIRSETACRVKVDVEHGKDLTRYIGAKGSLALRLKFYVEGAKGRQRKSLSVPIQIQAAEPDGSEQAAASERKPDSEKENPKPELETRPE